MKRQQLPTADPCGTVDLGLKQSEIDRTVLKLTKKSDYGLIALRHLAVVPRESAATAKEIAEAYHIPLPLLSKVLQSLSKTGFLVSEQGASGGYRLSRDPRTISTLEVITAIDGPVFLASCFHAGRECDQNATCTVKEPLRKVHEGILKLLADISIFDLSTDLPELPRPIQTVWPILGAAGERTQTL
ncbi:MAG: Rrf2 family transcriptional regulator [Bryobacteraceae bacterium]